MSSPYLRLSRIEADLDVVDRSSRHTEPTTAADERHRPDARSDEAAATTLDAALAGGMALMREDGERLVQGGVTSREELVRVTRDG